MQSNVTNGAGGTRRAAGAGRVGRDARPGLRGRPAERAAALAKATAQAPWRQAIAFARATKRAARDATSRPGRGATRAARSNAMQPEAGTVPRLTRLTPTKAIARRSTPPAGTWEPDLRSELEKLFGPAAPLAWHVPLASPVVGTAAASGGICVQQFHAEPATGHLSRW
jgi:hypothetical protein